MTFFSKKPDEQEWTRGRATGTRDREEPSAEGSEPRTGTPPTPAVREPAPAAGHTVRPPQPDVNVTIPGRHVRPSNAEMSEIESLIGERTTFDGTFKSEGSIRILGTVKGEIESRGAIYIEERAQVQAKVAASQVTIAGQVEGQISCEGRAEIRATGRVTGEIRAGALIIHEGAFFDGTSAMTTAQKPTDATRR